MTGYGVTKHVFCQTYDKAINEKQSTFKTINARAYYATGFCNVR